MVERGAAPFTPRVMGFTSDFSLSEPLSFNPFVDIRCTSTSVFNIYEFYLSYLSTHCSLLLDCGIN